MENCLDDLFRIVNCRYNISGFVEELPRLPEDRLWHACGALPVTQVREAFIYVLADFVR